MARMAKHRNGALMRVLSARSVLMVNVRTATLFCSATLAISPCIRFDFVVVYVVVYVVAYVVVYEVHVAMNVVVDAVVDAVMLSLVVYLVAFSSLPTCFYRSCSC